jgi:hypothetical protein
MAKTRDLTKYAGLPLDPTLEEVWDTALQRKVKIPIEGRANMQRLRHKLYQARLIIGAKDLARFQLLSQLTITITLQGKEHFELTISAGDPAIQQALKKAGFMSVEPDDDFLDPTK